MPRCISPLMIPDKSPFGRPLNGYVKLDGVVTGAPRLVRVVPCGKCVNCLRNKRSDFACRIVREADRYGSMVFVTFTYRPDKVPFSCRLFHVDRDTGECFFDEKAKILPPSALLDSLRVRHDYALKSSKPFYYFQSLGISDDDGELMYQFTPSLSRLDWRLWLKRERISYKRTYKKPLPDFKYVCVGEYGPNTVRPHFHACFIGLSLADVYRITQSWRDDFGFTYIENVNAVNKDGSSGFVKASQYVAKYLFKGTFDNPAVISLDAEKGRICCSLGLGTWLSPSEKSFYMCEDLFGVLDWKHCCKINGQKLTENEIKSLATAISLRSVICVAGSYFRLPRSIVRYLFYETVKLVGASDKVVKFQYQATPLRRKLANALQSNFMENYWRQFHSDLRYNFERQGYAGIRKTIQRIEVNRVFETAAREADFRKSLSSIF